MATTHEFFQNKNLKQEAIHMDRDTFNAYMCSHIHLAVRTPISMHKGSSTFMYKRYRVYHFIGEAYCDGPACTVRDIVHYINTKQM